MSELAWKCVLFSSYIVSLLDLVKDEYTFGRGEECDYSFEILGGKKNPHFLALSKTHFRIYRVS